MAKFPAPTEGIVMTHFIVSRDVERSRRFYTKVLGGETVLEGEPSIVALANGWIIINVGGGPTNDSRRSRSRRRRIRTRSAPFSISGSPTSTPSTKRGAGAGRNS